MNLIHCNDLKTIVNLSCMGNIVPPNGFTIIALGSPSEQLTRITNCLEIIAKHMLV